jgi:putative IMPACT (imprinted ancient) family translation regulator
LDFFTVERIFQAEFEEKQSRFIAHLVPYLKFEETLENLRSAHPKASHHVTAFRLISEQNQISEQQAFADFMLLPLYILFR